MELPIKYNIRCSSNAHFYVNNIHNTQFEDGLLQKTVHQFAFALIECDPKLQC